MRTWFPYPLLSIALLLMWLLLSQSVTPGSIVLGLVVSTVLAWVTLNLQPARSRLHRWSRIAGFILRVVGDVIRSNIAVTLIILRAGRRPVNAGFMTVSLDLDDENALALLACVVTATPAPHGSNMIVARRSCSSTYSTSKTRTCGGKRSRAMRPT